MQCLSLVPLTYSARANKVLDQPAIVVDDKVAAQTLERLLDSFMTDMGQLQDRW
jgi:hypothetical protein